MQEREELQDLALEVSTAVGVGVCVGVGVGVCEAGCVTCCSGDPSALVD